MYVGVYSETRIDKVWFYIIIIAFDVGKRILILSPGYPEGIVLYTMRFHGLDAILDWLAHLASMMAHWTSISCDRILGHGNGSVLIVDLIAVIIDYSSLPIPIKHLN